MMGTKRNLIGCTLRILICTFALIVCDQVKAYELIIDHVQISKADTLLDFNCRPRIAIMGRSTLDGSTASDLIVDRWKQEVKHEYGRQFTDPKISREWQAKCTKYVGNPEFYCRVSAYPCK